MALDTKIAWCDSTWNPWTGCDPVSAGCLNCYAARWARRCGRPFSGPRRTAAPTFNAPLHWPTTGEDRRPRLVFVCSLSDFFHPGADTLRAEAWQVMKDTPWHTYILLTKRPHLIADRLPDGWPWPHVGLGVTTEDQPAACERVPILCGLEAAFRMVSAEPLIGGVDLSYNALWMDCPSCGGTGEITDPAHPMHPNQTGDAPGQTWCLDCNTDPARVVAGIDWIVGAGESADPMDGARPTHLAWAELLRDQAEATGVPFCWKGWGEWTPYEGLALGNPRRPVPKHVLVGMEGEVLEAHTGNIAPDPMASRQGVAWLIGRKRTGRKLAGQIWDQRPEISDDRRALPRVETERCE